MVRDGFDTPPHTHTYTNKHKKQFIRFILISWSRLMQGHCMSYTWTKMNYGTPPVVYTVSMYVLIRWENGAFRGWRSP